MDVSPLEEQGALVPSSSGDASGFSDEHLSETIAALQRESARRRGKAGGKGSGGGGKAAPRKFTGECWQCGAEGHRASECPHLSPEERARRSAGSKGKGKKQARGSLRAPGRH